MLDKRMLEVIRTVSRPSAPWASMQQATGVPRHRWLNLAQGKQRATTEMIEAVARVWPEYVYWLVTGKTAPDHPCKSPVQDRIDRDTQLL